MNKKGKRMLRWNYWATHSFKVLRKKLTGLLDHMFFPYVRGASDRLRKQLAWEGVNVIFKRGQTLRKYLINGGPPKNNRRKNIVYKITCETCNFCYIGETLQWFDDRETQHKRSLKNCHSNNGIYMHILKHLEHVIA